MDCPANALEASNVLQSMKIFASTKHAFSASANVNVKQLHTAFSCRGTKTQDYEITMKSNQESGKQQLPSQSLKTVALQNVMLLSYREFLSLRVFEKKSQQKQLFSSENISR